MFEVLTKKIKSFGFMEGEFALFGSAPIVARGLRDFTHDIDILVSKRIWDECRKKDKEWIYKKFERDGRVIEELEHEGGNIELYYNWAPGEWDEDRLMREAEIIDGLPFVKLEDVLKWKKLSAREKDLKDAALIENYLRSSGGKKPARGGGFVL